MSIPRLRICRTNSEDWRVHIEFPDATFEEVSGFRSEEEANEWIAIKFEDWMQLRQKVQGPDGAHSE
jgi:hypothetical protein